MLSTKEFSFRLFCSSFLGILYDDLVFIIFRHIVRIPGQ